MKVRLTLLADGCTLGITLAHVLFDGTRWPQFAEHLAQHYVAAAGGPPADPERLLHPCDRRQLSAEHMARQLLG